jgi:hypothetical protein
MAAKQQRIFALADVAKRTNLETNFATNDIRYHPQVVLRILQGQGV